MKRSSDLIIKNNVKKKARVEYLMCSSNNEKFPEVYSVKEDTVTREKGID